MRALESGRERTFSMPTGMLTSGPSWQPDGSAVFLGLDDMENDRPFAVARVDLSSGEVRTIGSYAAPAGHIWDPRFTPASEQSIYVTATSDSGQSQIVDVNLARGSTRALFSLHVPLRIRRVVRGTVGQAVQVASQVVSGAPATLRRDGKRVAVSAMKDGTSAVLVAVDVDGANYREVFGPIPAGPEPPSHSPLLGIRHGWTTARLSRSASSRTI